MTTEPTLMERAIVAISGMSCLVFVLWFIFSGIVGVTITGLVIILLIKLIGTL